MSTINNKDFMRCRKVPYSDVEGASLTLAMINPIWGSMCACFFCTVKNFRKNTRNLYSKFTNLVYLPKMRIFLQNNW